MLKSKLIIAAVALVMGLSSCGIFHKSCNCPHFGKVTTPAKNGQEPVIYAARLGN